MPRLCDWVKERSISVSYIYIYILKHGFIIIIMSEKFSKTNGGMSEVSSSSLTKLFRHCGLVVRHCGLVGSAPAWDGTGCEFDSWQCRIYIPCSLSLRLLGFLRDSLGTYGLTQKLCLKKHFYIHSSVQLFFEKNRFLLPSASNYLQLSSCLFDFQLIFG